MVRLRVQKEFTLKDYAKVNAIKKQAKQDDFFITGDIIECDNEMAKYLDGENALKTSFVKVIEVIPDEKPVEKQKEEKPKKVAKKTKKKLDK